MSDKKTIVEMIKALTPEQRAFLASEEGRKLFEQELNAEIDQRIQQRTDQAEAAADRGE